MESRFLRSDRYNDRRSRSFHDTPRYDDRSSRYDAPRAYDAPRSYDSPLSYDDRPARGPRTLEIVARDVRCTVKWFNTTKGFGFASPADGSADVFLHASALNALGHDTLPEGATVVCDLANGAKGRQVASVSSVDLSTAVAPTRGFRSPRAERDDAATESVEATVKWFNETKGFGFATPTTGGKDVFVHASALRRSGLTTIAEGAKVTLEIRQGDRGPEAVKVETI